MKSEPNYRYAYPNTKYEYTTNNDKIIKRPRKRLLRILQKQIMLTKINIVTIVFNQKEGTWCIRLGMGGDLIPLI